MSINSGRHQAKTHQRARPGAGWRIGAEQDSLTHARSGMTNDLGTQLGQQFKEQIYGALR